MKGNLKNFVNYLKVLNRNVDIADSDGVWGFINNYYVGNGKRIYWEYYQTYAKTINMKLEKLTWKVLRKSKN